MPKLYEEPGPTNGQHGIRLWVDGGGYFGALAGRIADRVATDPAIRARVAELVDEEFADNAWENERRNREGR